MTRCFVAVWPDATTTDRLRDRLDALVAPGEAGVKPVPTANWHVTLRFLGDVDVDEAAATLARARLPSATAVLGPRLRRLGPRQIVVPVDGVDELATAVRDATVGIGRPDGRRFRGHLTVARTRPHVGSALLGIPFEADFRVAEVALVTSVLDAAGATYTTAARFPTTA